MKLFGKKKMFAFLLGIVVMIQNAGIVNSNVLAIENNDYNLYSNNDEIPSAETRLADMTESVTSIMETDYLKGDINNDGSFDAVDLGTFIKWLSGDSDTELEKIKAADLSDDGNLNVLDLCLMKNELISGQNSDVVPNNDEILCGYYDADYSKPLPSQRVALKTRSFCNPDETLKVDVAMGDSYAHAQKYGNVPAYDTPGHAEYGIYACSDYYNYPKIEDEKLIINGNTGEYLKEYSKEEMNQLDISYKYGEYDSYHHEIAEIDFKKYEAGSTGCIAFYFAWKFDGENPLNLSSQYSGMSQHLYYYVGEKGVSVSDLGIDNAKEDYLSVWGELTNEEI